MRDARTGTTPQKQRPKPKPAVLGPGLSGEHAQQESPKPRFTGHDEPPSPVLRKAGFVGGILAFNDHVDAIVRAHQGTFGYDPPAGLTLDVARSAVDKADYGKLFPSDSKRAYGLAQKYGGLESDEDRLLGELKQAVSSGNYADWMRENGTDLAELGQDNPDFARKYAPLVMRGQGQHYSGISMKGGKLFDALGFTAKAVSQVATGLTVGPAVFAWEEGKAGYHDVGALVHANLPTHLAKTNVKLGKGIVKGAKEDIQHPGDNAGNLFLDALGLLSIGAGAVTKAGAVGRAARAGEGLRGVGKAAVRRPTAGTYEIQYGSSVASPLLSENSALRQVQKLFYGRVQKVADLKHQGVIPAGAADAVGKRASLRALSALAHPFESLPVEALIRSEWKAQDRVLAAARQAVIAPVVNAGHTSVRASLLPKLSKKLTAGEQKAIQVLLTDIEGPFRNQLETQRGFHDSMIEAGIGDPADHRAQLEALTLAENVMGKKPRPEFVSALEDISRSVDIMEAIKANEMGLLTGVAEGRVAKAGQAFRQETLTGGEKVNPASRYLPFVSATRKIGKSSDAGGFWNPTPGPFGIPIPGTDPSLTHQFTAHYIKAGDIRFDSSNLAGEAFGRAVRSASRMNAWKRLHDAAVEEHRPGYLPVRSERNISQPLREVMAKNELSPLTAEDLELLAPDGGDLDAFLFPDPKTIAVDDPTVRWVSPKLLDSRRVIQRPHWTMRTAMGVNEVLRDTILFLKPSYALNALGNAGMAGLHQGPALIPNLVRSVTSIRRYGAETTRILDGLAGESKSISYAPELRTGKRLSNIMAAGWNKLTDRVWRRAAVIHELRRADISDIPGTLEKYAKGEAGELAEKVVEASRRAKKSMVELDNLSWFEKETLRHIVFVYPWVSRSLVWSLRTILEHPIKSAVLAHVTAGADQDKALEHAPYWLKNLGYIPTGVDKDGNPKVAGFGSINTFVTLSEAMGLLSGKETLEETLGPGAELGLRLVTNKDRFGNEYETPVIGPITDSLIGLPQYRALARSQESGEPGAKPLDTTDVMSLVQREHGALKGDTKRSVFVPEGYAALWSLVIGGLHERVVDRAAIDARFWRDQPPEKRHKHEVELVNKMLRLQAGFLKKPLPREVREAVDFNFDREYAFKQFAKKNGRGPTQKERAQITIDMLENGADIGASVAKKLRTKLDKTKTPDLDDFTRGLLHHYAGGKALAAWRQDVETVASFDRRLLDYNIGNGVDAGVVDSEYRNAANVPDETLQELGRRYLAYEKEIQKRQDAADGKKRDEKTLLSLQLREWIDQQDQPVTINGHKFPPLPRLAVARMNRDQLRAHLIDVSLSSWEGLSVTDKELAGKKSSPAVATAWAEYKIGLAKAVAKLPPGERRLDANQKLAVVKQVDRWYKLNGAFLRDYLFAQRPRISQMSELRIFTEAPPGAKQEFQYLVDNARQLEIAEKNGNISRTDAKAVWRDWMAGLVVEGGYYQTEGIAFWRYVQPYVKRDPDFLSDLLN
jgi:hypothetical protein